jgi:hypothetical protein
MAKQSEQSRPTGRAHHFVFVHEALPSVLHHDPERFVDDLRGPNGQDRLERFWTDVGARVVERGAGASHQATGLAAEPVDGNGWRGVVIHMPRVEELGECALVLMMVPNPPVKGQLWHLYKERGAPVTRFFMLKLLQLPHMEKPEFKICELSVILGNVTTGYTCAPTTADFVREVVERLDVEV